MYKTTNITRENVNYPLLYLITMFIGVSNIRVLGIYIVSLISLGYIIAYRRSKIKIGGSGKSLLLFSLMYFLFLLVNGNALSTSIKPLFYVIIWSCCYDLSRNKKVDSILSFVSILSYGMLFHGLLNLFYNTINGTNMTRGISYDYWSQAMSTATGQAINFTLFISISFYLIFLHEKKWLRVVNVVLMALMIIYDIQLGGRTALLLILISVVIGAGLYSVLEGFRTGSFKRSLFLMIGLAFIIVLVIIAYNNNYFGIKNIYENSYLNYRITGYNGLDLAGNDRFDKKALYYINMLKYPFGGNNLRLKEGFGFSHELWLDLYDEAGIIPYICLIIYTIRSVGNIIHVVRVTDKIEYKTTFILYGIVMMIQFFVEPILGGATMLWVCYICVDAALQRYRDDSRVNELVRQSY